MIAGGLSSYSPAAAIPVHITACSPYFRENWCISKEFSAGCTVIINKHINQRINLYICEFSVQTGIHL